LTYVPQNNKYTFYPFNRKTKVGLKKSPPEMCKKWGGVIIEFK